MGLNRQIFKNTAIYAFATVLGRLISFLMLPFYAHIFQTEGYGIIGVIDASLGVLVVLFSSGFHEAILRIYHEEDEAKKGLVISTAMRLVWLLGLGVILVPLVLSRQLSSILLGSEKHALLFCLALLTFVIDVSGQSASTFLIIKQRSVLYSVVGLIRLLVGLVLNVWLVIVLRVGLVGVFITSLATAVIASAIFHYFSIREYGLGYDRVVARKLVKFQLPLLPGEVISFASRQAESFIVRFLIDLRSVGVLEMAYKFPPLMTVFVTFPFMRAWRSKSIEMAEEEDAPRIMGKMFTNYFFAIVFAGLLLALTIRDILMLMTPPDFWDAASITRIEVITSILAGSQTFLVFGLVYRKKTKIISCIKTVVAPFKIVVSTMMIYFFHLKGAAYSALIAETVSLLVTAHKAQKSYPISLEYRKLVVVASYAATLFIFVQYLSDDHFVAVSGIKDVLAQLIDVCCRCIPAEIFGGSRLESILRHKTDQVISLVINVVFGLSFLLLVPWIYPESNANTGQAPRLGDNAGT